MNKSTFKKYLLTIALVLGAFVSQAQQCVLIYEASADTIDCGDSVIVVTNGLTDSAAINNFNAGFNPLWSEIGSPTINSTCNPSLIPPPPDNSDYLWMGNLADVPRVYSSPPIDMTPGGQICFDLIYAVQGGNCNNAEGPDLCEEGVSLQYSTTGGPPWIDIAYFQPDGTILPANPGPACTGGGAAGATPFTAWGNYCFPIPAGAQTANTQVRWAQEFSSTTNFDHWGLDEIFIDINLVNYGIFDGSGNFLPSGEAVLFPTADTTATFILTNGIDSCSADVDIFLNPTDAGPDIQVACDGLGIQLQASGVSALASLTWSPSSFLSDPSVANPTADPVADIDYVLTSDCGVDTVSVFVEESFTINVTGPDTICLNGSAFLNLTTAPTSVTIGSVDWTPTASLNTGSGNSVLASPLATTSYVATVTSDSGCVIQDTVVVNVQGVAASVDVTPDNPRVCSGESVTLTASVNTPLVPYTLVQGTYNPYPTTGTPVTGLGDDNFVGPIPIGFGVPFFGTNYTQLWVGSNGWISFNAPTGSFLGNATIPSGAQPNNIIAWGWDDLNFNGGGTFNYSIGGTAPNQYIVLNFLNVNHFGSAATISVQVVIYQNGLIEINNINVVPDNAFGTMTQGIENGNGTQGLSDPLLNNTAITSIGENWTFVPFTAPANAVYTWTPATNLSTTSGPVTEASPQGTTEYFVTMVDGFCSSSASVIVNVDSLYASSITNDIFLECPEDSIQLDVTAVTTIFNSLDCGGPEGLCVSPPVTDQVGFGTGVSGTSGTGNTGNSPFGWWFANGKRHMLYTAAELNAMGFSGGNIYSLAFNITQKNSTTPIPQFAIGVKCVPNTTTTISNISETGFQNVFSSPSYTTAVGWNTFNFTAPYVWDGVSNLLVQVCFGTGTTPWGRNDHVQVSPTVGNQFAYGYADNPGAPGCSVSNFGSAAALSTKPNARFNYCNVTPGFAPVTYSWSSNPVLAFDDNTINNPLIVDEVVQSSVAIVEFNDGTCTAYDTVSIDFGAGYTVTADTAICEGEDVQLNVTGGSNIVWSPNDGSLSSTTIPNPVATPASTTSYFVNLDLTNCSVVDTVEVTVNPLPVSLINNGDANAAVCDGAIANLVSDADSAWTNNWAGPENGTGTAVDVGTEGIYTLTSTDANGCISSSTITVSFNDNPVLDPNVVRNILCCNGDEVIVNFQDLVTNGVTIDEAFWDNSVTPSGPSVSVASGEDGTYDVQLISVEGCEGTTQITFATNCINPDIVDQDSVIFGGTTPFEVNGDLTIDNEVWTPNFTNNTYTANTVANDFETVLVEASSSFVLNDGSTYECVELDSSQIFVFLIADPELPDAFTPNGDNLNDLLFPINLDPNATITSFQVYNRWGDLVYEYNGDNGWDGTWNGADQPSDVYTYYLAVDKTSETFVTSGNVTLFR